jgi:hypothetical protein
MPAAQQAIQILRRHFEPADREASRYHYVAFDVAEPTESLTISYRYTGDNGANVLDLGLFEPGSLALGTPAFRGYSGGAQRTISVGRTTSSPGYRTGPLPLGRWHVLLGLYKVAPGGVDVTIEVGAARESYRAEDAASPTNAIPAPAAAAPPALSPVEGPALSHVEGPALSRVEGPALSHVEGRWYSGALHLHTTHSDGALGARALADAAAAAGFDFFAITDHNNSTHAREPLPASPLHVVGEEVTTPAGHANVWGLPPDAWIDFRVRPGDANADQAIDALVAEASRAGALFSINHPVDVCAGCSWEQVVPSALDAIEIWNGSREPSEPAIAMWDRLLRSGRRVTAVGASDWHRGPAPIETPAVRVLAERLTQAAILDAIRQGRVIVVRDTHLEPPVVEASCGAAHASIGATLICRSGERVAVRVGAASSEAERVDLFWNGEKRGSKQIGRHGPESGRVDFEVPAADGYLRVHLYAAGASALAITNPIYVALR